MVGTAVMQLLRPLLAVLTLLRDAGAPDDATDGPSEARCATLFHSGQLVSAELCFEALVARHPDNADHWMDWAVVANNRAREIVQSGPVAPPEASERAAHLASAIARYDRALEVGGRLYPTTDGRGYYLYGRAEALKAADQLEASADTYREIDRLRRGAPVPWPAGEAEAWAARLAEGRARHAKLERCWQQRTSPTFTAALARFCEKPEELAFVRQLFQPGDQPSPGPLRFFQDWPISDFRSRGGAFYVSLFKLEHDMQQLARLLADGELPPSFWQVLGNFTQAHAGLAALTADRTTPIVFPAEVSAAAPFASSSEALRKRLHSCMRSWPRGLPPTSSCRPRLGCRATRCRPVSTPRRSSGSIWRAARRSWWWTSFSARRRWRRCCASRRTRRCGIRRIRATWGPTGRRG